MKKQMKVYVDDDGIWFEMIGDVPNDEDRIILSVSELKNKTLIDVIDSRYEYNILIFEWEE